MKVVAECGVNWDNLNEAVKMIAKAKEVGCWAAKFQLFNKEVAPNLPEHLYLNYHQAKDLFEYGRDFGIEVFFTPMFERAVKWCEDIGVNYYKIRYKDRANFDLINKIKDTLKPYFRSINNDYSVGIDEFSLLCVPDYPAKRYDYGLPPNFWFKYQGISDHTPDTKFLKELLYKDIYFEKHVKLDNNCIESDWSCTFEELAEVLKDG